MTEVTAAPSATSTTIAMRWIQRVNCQPGWCDGHLNLVIVSGLIRGPAQHMGASNVGDDAESALMGKCCSWCPLPGPAVVNQAAMRLGPLGFHPLHLRP